MQRMRGSHQQRPAAHFLHPQQSRHQHGNFAQADTIQQDFGECPTWPAPTGQFGIKRGKTTGYARQDSACHMIAAPDIGPGQDFSEGDCSVHKASPLRIRPTAMPSMTSELSATMGL